MWMVQIDDIIFIDAMKIVAIKLNEYGLVAVDMIDGSSYVISNELRSCAVNHIQAINKNITNIQESL